jgi:hypothetical protein
MAMSRRLLPRKDLWPALREVGIPIGDSTGAKLCSPSINEGPPIAYWWGKQPIHDFDEAVEWAKARMSATRKKLAGVNW